MSVASGAPCHSVTILSKLGWSSVEDHQLAQAQTAGFIIDDV
jgi:hypothetical protein